MAALYSPKQIESPVLVSSVHCIVVIFRVYRQFISACRVGHDTLTTVPHHTIVVQALGFNSLALVAHSPTRFAR